MKIFTKISILLLTTIFLHGCAAPLIGFAALGTTAVVGSDDRTVARQLGDTGLAHDATADILKLKYTEKELNFEIFSNNSYMLIIGQATTQEIKDKVDARLKAFNFAKKTYNQIRVKKPIDFNQKASDTWITTKIKTKFTKDSDVNSLKIKVVTEDSEVFLIGETTKAIAAKATSIASNTDGVARVIRVFQITD